MREVSYLHRRPDPRMTIIGSALGTIALCLLVVLVLWWAERGAVGRRR